jgi:hypothetical protein
VSTDGSSVEGFSSGSVFGAQEFSARERDDGDPSLLRPSRSGRGAFAVGVAKGRTKDAMLAFEKCAEANGKEDNEWHAAKSFEMCLRRARVLCKGEGRRMVQWVP